MRARDAFAVFDKKQNANRTTCNVIAHLFKRADIPESFAVHDMTIVKVFWMRLKILKVLDN